MSVQATFEEHWALFEDSFMRELEAVLYGRHAGPFSIPRNALTYSISGSAFTSEAAEDSDMAWVGSDVRVEFLGGVLTICALWAFKDSEILIESVSDLIWSNLLDIENALGLA